MKKYIVLIIFLLLASSFTIALSGCSKLKKEENLSDLEMIKKADISAVPADTPEDIKAHADFIAGRCEDGAVADFIDYLANIKSDMA